jgi:hypothetical protein
MKPEELIGRFVEHLARMQSERAREFAESEKLRTDWAAFSAVFLGKWKKNIWAICWLPFTVG